MIVELDRYLSLLTRRLRLYLGAGRVVQAIETLQRSYALRYAQSRRPWAVIDDFDGNLKLKLDRSSLIGSSIYWKGFISINELHLLNRILRPGMVFLDVGANQGEFAVYAAKRVPRGTVVAFEPNPASNQQLRENVALNGFANVVISDVGLLDRAAVMQLYTSDERTHHHHTGPGLAMPNEGVTTLYQSEFRASRGDLVRTAVLDQLYPGLGLDRLDVLKIDVEGAELPVLRGARETISRYSPIIILELNEETFNAAGYTTRDVLSFLMELGYEFYVIGHHKFREIWRYGPVGRYGRATHIDSEALVRLPTNINVACRRLAL
jgi:FkbM family methyltransferase